MPQQDSTGSPAQVPCVYGEGLCTPEQNDAEAAVESYCGPGQRLPDGTIVPKPGC